MSDFAESPSRTEFKTPNAKSVNLTAEATTRGDDDDEKDTSVMIPHKSSPVVQLPPVQSDDNPQLIVKKKRKLQLVADPDETVEPSQVIPSKSRSSSNVSTRIPSLNEISKPELSPPSLNLSYRSFEEKESPTTAPSSSSKDQIVANTASAATRNFSSPIRLDQNAITSTPDDPKKLMMSLRRQENSVDSELVKARKKLETLRRAKVILSKKDAKNNEELIDKWRDAAQRASNYLLNASVEKINKAGGKKEYERREREKLRDNLEFTMDTSFQERISEVTRSEEYEALPEDEQERILQDLEEEAEKSMRQLEKDLDAKNKHDDDNDDNDDEFTMKDLYKRLKLDYKLVFPEK
ncbi:hypothetical protein WICANDRAFT_65755 [Wickerhamomyces anomalus NRRL Y-366-8]|uniref:Meiosis protein 5 n=1 Tax=Wickerhamomyces anomalus (strain ATCC 58044 / CBS 1984 / NCYC 433 / NRRL Y-366-8) TaxID=683960 RepID=A0A1E3NUV2_WICAA|nr:uncharacterized protein WICANDRAFT_65755 [Wickerhamomyces anomalus NRRL Y-366-8]ODQ56873.1 hypothetical protein WICANDRAFT_65755 [Wickerhamomyces anomalus NRRL Y-366-8]